MFYSFFLCYAINVGDGMYKVEYCKEERVKDLTYDDAFYNSLNNNNTKWGNYYSWLKEKYDLCYNIDYLIIDVMDIENMKYDCFSNGILLNFYLKCKKDHILEKYEQIAIHNDSIYMEELIYNIIKSDWLINKELVDNDKEELLRRKRYFKSIIEVSEDKQDIKIQFRNKLYSYFLETLSNLDKEERLISSDKILKLTKSK